MWRGSRTFWSHIHNHVQKRSMCLFDILLNVSVHFWAFHTGRRALSSVLECHSRLQLCQSERNHVDHKPPEWSMCLRPCLLVLLTEGLFYNAWRRSPQIKTAESCRYAALIFCLFLLSVCSLIRAAIDVSFFLDVRPVRSVCQRQLVKS